MIKLNSIQFLVSMQSNGLHKAYWDGQTVSETGKKLDNDSKETAKDFVISQIQGFTALRQIEPYEINVEHDDDDGEILDLIVSITRK